MRLISFRVRRVRDRGYVIRGLGIPEGLKVDKLRFWVWTLTSRVDRGWRAQRCSGDIFLSLWDSAAKGVLLANHVRPVIIIPAPTTYAENGVTPSLLESDI